MNVLDQQFDCGNGDELVCVHLSSRLSPFSYVYHGLNLQIANQIFNTMSADSYFQTPAAHDNANKAYKFLD